MSSGLIPEKCPECGGPLKFLEKNSFNGHVFREYWCAKCEDMITLDGGEALWQVLHEATTRLRELGATRIALGHHRDDTKVIGKRWYMM